MIEENRGNCLTTWGCERTLIECRSHSHTEAQPTGGCVPSMTCRYQASWLVSRWSPTNIETDPTVSCHNVRRRFVVSCGWWDNLGRWINDSIIFHILGPAYFPGDLQLSLLQDFVGGTLHSWSKPGRSRQIVFRKAQI